MVRRTLIAGAVFLGMLALTMPLAVAQTSFPDVDGDGVPDIPEGAPGEYDIQEGDARFGDYVVLWGETTQIADFGDSSKLKGQCGGFAWSYDSDGQIIDGAFDAGDDEPPVDVYGAGPFASVQAFTESNPFLVDAAGTVVYYGEAEIGPDRDGPLEHRWYIRTQGISLDEGGDPNTAGNNRNAGIVDLDEQLPIKFTGLFRIEGNLMSQNGITCDGHGWFELTGPFPLMTVTGLLASVFFLGGIFGLLFNARPAITWRA